MELDGRDYIYTQTLRSLIIQEIASTESIVFSTLNMLRETGVITEIKKNKWKIKLPDGTPT